MVVGIKIKPVTSGKSKVIRPKMPKLQIKSPMTKGNLLGKGKGKLGGGMGPGVSTGGNSFGG